SIALPALSCWTTQDTLAVKRFEKVNCELLRCGEAVTLIIVLTDHFRVNRLEPPEMIGNFPKIGGGVFGHPPQYADRQLVRDLVIDQRLLQDNGDTVRKLNTDCGLSENGVQRRGPSGERTGCRG